MVIKKYCRTAAQKWGVKMYCPYCGKELEEGKGFCTNCGAPLPEIRGLEKVKRNNAGVIAFSIALAYAVICICIIGPVTMSSPEYINQEVVPLVEWMAMAVLPVVTLIMGWIAFSRRNRFNCGNGMTLAGICISGASVGACVCLAVIMFMMLL